MDISKESKLSELIVRHLQGDNSLQELQQLKQLLRDDREAVELYVEYMMQFSALTQPGKVIIEDLVEEPSPPMLDTSLWMALLKYEKEAPEIELSKEKPQRELIQKVVHPTRKKRKVSKFSIVFLAMNAAAILFIFLFLRFAPLKDGIEVATLTDSINAEWADAGISMEKGTRLHNDKTSFLLREGLVELTFDNSTQVTIEGPAKFQILDSDMIKLNYGQLYSQVPSEAYGFQVCTQNAKVIDLGTEFGVKEELDGDTEVHVLKGKVNLVSGILNKKININLLVGSACRLNSETGELKEIPCKDNSFVRQIDSKTNIIWRGQETLDLADIIGGGNGFGTGRPYTGIDPLTGKFNRMSNEGRVREGTDKCILVPESSFIDTVFVPNQNQQDFPISSSGLTFKSFKTANGKAWCEICNGVKNFNLGGDLAETLTLNGLEYGTGQRSMIMFHANAGITFDLDMIRKSLPGLDVTEFHTVLGIPDISAKPGNVTTLFDAYVLLDGKDYFHREKINATSEEISITIPINRNQRFLTLALTDSGNDNYVDYAILAEPILVLSEAE